MFQAGRADSGASNSAPTALLIVLLLALGAAVYLYKAGYIRKAAGASAIIVLTCAFAAVSLWIYKSGG